MASPDSYWDISNGEMVMVKTVLVAVDSSDLAWRVIAALEQLCLDDNCVVVLAHIVPPPEPDETVAVDVPHVEVEHLFHDREAWLDTLREKIDYSTIPEIVTGDPAEEIVRLAGIHQCELIVLGSRGLKGLSRIIQGSVSSQVVADAPCSVFVVKN
jgi:nucleotide-binding universal stress UspA family protein